MKTYSSDAVTKDYVDRAIKATTEVSTRTAKALYDVDDEQGRQIKTLQRLLAASFAVNLLVAIGAYFF